MGAFAIGSAVFEQDQKEAVTSVSIYLDCFSGSNFCKI